MPLFDFICDDEQSPYCPDNMEYNGPLTEYMSHEEFNVIKNNIKCPVTNSPMRRVWNNPPRANFTGSGFHETDYK